MTENEAKLAAPPTVIDNEQALAEAVRGWRRRKAIALDTEFVRERTFYQIPGLIQVCDGKENYLIDLVAVRDLGAFEGLLQDAEVVKVFHSCSEDLEIFYHLCGFLPRPIFDTQIAAAFVGLGHPIGYQGLVAQLFKAHIPKHQTRTDWTQRPLTPEQVEYAALDVAFLVRAYRTLRGRLRRKGREQWAREEFERLDSVSRFVPDDENYYKQVKGAGRLTPHELAVLNKLTVWREKEARRRDRPRGFVLHDRTLVELSEIQPGDLQHLRKIHGVGSKTVKYNGERILQLIEEGKKVPKKKLPRPLKRNVDTRKYEDEIEAAKEVVQKAAEELDMPPEFLAQRRVILNLIKHSLIDRREGLPKELQGWREKVVGREMLEAITRN